MIRVEHVRKSYQEALVLNDVSFQVERGEFFGIIGPNGSGKSTLVKLMSVIERADAGRVVLDGLDTDKHTRKSLARWMAVLQQETLPQIGFTVREVVEMGRYPYQNWLGEEKVQHAGDSASTEDLIEGILGKLGLSDLADRPLAHLSGGERQRVALGKTMAQQPRLLILDEPTTYLDIGHQIHLMDRIAEWRQATGMTVVAVLHDLNLAALYCDRLLLLNKGCVAAIGTPRELLRADLIREVYGITPIITEHPVQDQPQLLLSPQTEFGARRADKEHQAVVAAGIVGIG